MKRIMMAALGMGAALLLFTGCNKSSSETASSESTVDQAKPVEQTKSLNQTKTPAEYAKAPKKAEPKPVKVTIPAGTQFTVALTETVQTNKNVAGQEFSGTLTQPVEKDGKVVVAEGAKASLVITKLVKGGTLKTPPQIAFTVTDVTMSNGKSYNVEADTFYQKGKSHTGREVGMIGGGAAAGAIIGGVVGKGKGAVIGAAAGAAAGTGVAAATGRENLVYPTGLTVTFTLQNSLTITVPKGELASSDSKTK